MGELTVRETFDFAARVQGVGHKEGMASSATRLRSNLLHAAPCTLD